MSDWYGKAKKFFSIKEKSKSVVLTSRINIKQEVNKNEKEKHSKT